jgi:hypothetical protein
MRVLKDGIVQKGNLTVTHDPGFVNAKKSDFSLRKDSEVWKKMPNFRPIPFKRIGVQKPDPKWFF